ENTRLRLSDGTTEQEQDGSISDQYNASANLEFTIFDGFGNYYRLQSLRNTEELGSTESRLQIENTLIEVIQSYLEVLSSEQLVEINQEIVEVSEERYRRAEQQFESGGSRRVDLLNAEVNLNQDSIRYVQSQSDLSQQKRDLVLLMGDEPSDDVEIRPDLTINKNLEVHELIQQALNSNASVQTARLETNQARLSLKETKSNRYPQITAQTSYSYNRSESDANFIRFQETDGFSGGINFSFNIFNGFQQSIQTQSDEIRLKNSQEQERLAEKEIRKELENAYEDYTTNLYLLDKQELNVKTAELNFERTEEAFELGQVSNTDFREAQLNLLEANQELIDLEINAKLSEVQLLQLSGQLLDQQ
ncbi:MAG: TolC family protein, partial [Bacteroidota bacterium]